MSTASNTGLKQRTCPSPQGSATGARAAARVAEIDPPERQRTVVERYPAVGPQTAVVDLVPALLAEAPQQIGRDRPAFLAVPADHDAACAGGLDHELGCDHAPLSGAAAGTSPIR